MTSQAYEQLPNDQRRALDREVDLIAAILTAAYWAANNDGATDSDVLQAWLDYRDRVGNVILSEL